MSAWETDTECFAHFVTRHHRSDERKNTFLFVIYIILQIANLGPRVLMTTVTCFMTSDNVSLLVFTELQRALAPGRRAEVSDSPGLCVWKSGAMQITDHVYSFPWHHIDQQELWRSLHLSNTCPDPTNPVNEVLMLITRHSWTYAPM